MIAKLSPAERMRLIIESNIETILTQQAREIEGRSDSNFPNSEHLITDWIEISILPLVDLDEVSAAKKKFTEWVNANIHLLNMFTSTIMYRNGTIYFSAIVRVLDDKTSNFTLTPA